MKKIVFGNALIETEIHYINSITKDDNSRNEDLLVIGCGSAGFLEGIKSQKYRKIHLLDKDAKMLSKAQVKFGKLENITFKCADFFHAQYEEQYDFIALPFFLDCLSNEEIEAALNKISSLLKPNGKLIISDFFLDSKSGIKSRILIRLMYLFFKLTTNINRFQLPDYKRFVEKEGFKIINTHENRSKSTMSLFCEKI